MDTVLLVVPLAHWNGSGLYLLDRPPEPDVWRCFALSGGALRLTQDGSETEIRTVTREEFANMVLGQVAGVCRVLDHDLVGL